MNKFIMIGLVILFGFSLSAHADDISLDDLRYEVQFRDGADFVQSQNKIPWFVDLQKTNLYRGLMIRMAGLTGALPKKEKPTWQGRLSDYIIEKVLSNRPVAMTYFQLGNLVSPTGFAISELGVTEKKIVTQIIEALRIADDSSVAVAQGEVGQATPIDINTQKIAVALNGNCLGLARDPKVAVATAQVCSRHKVFEGDARVAVNTRSLASSTAVAISKWSQLGQWFQLDFKKKSDGSFDILNASINLESDKSQTGFSNFEIPPVLGEALPATTLFAATFGIKLDKQFTKETLRAALTNPSVGSKTLPITFFYVGSEKTEEGILSDVGLLIPTKSGITVTEQDVTQIFGTYYGRELYARGVCNNSAVVVSPRSGLIEQIEAVCAKKVPAMKNSTSEVAKSFAPSQAYSSVFINPGKILSLGLRLGMQLDEMSETEKPEIVEAKQIVERVPAYHFLGQLTKDEVRFKAYSGVF